MSVSQPLSYTITLAVNKPGTIVHHSVVVKKQSFTKTSQANAWYEDVVSGAVKLADGLYSLVSFERDN